MITVETVYNGELRTTSQHALSGTQLITDAPPDNHGRGESFSPTDLLATSLGTCMLTVMGIEARKRAISIDGTRIEVKKLMNVSPRLVSEVRIKIFMPAVAYSDEHKELLERTARYCPVALSLHPDLKQTVEFFYKDE